ncbi:hypothetical protein BOTBODRAFT_529529 [Botryobasidium botryosum FD-172 SS1]|uniref:F-box domain-containing protein n=1 Tax=Botryobasidium botryosum (strain FD-172 SS1) TaxID=930990 RepID=A0A067MBX9_BOTB1|nr:hypothetical protein BOTBODRAFT_529529 [Botryobasidium botryosum FD-172 SS1]
MTTIARLGYYTNFRLSKIAEALYINSAVNQPQACTTLTFHPNSPKVKELSRMSAPFADSSFPIELTLQIMEELPFISIIRCLSVCKLFQSLIQSSTTLQYIIALGAEGYVDCPSGYLTVPERLALLERHKNAWHSLSWSHTKKFQMPESGRYELHHGVFAHGATHGITLITLPSRVRQTDGMTLQHSFEFPLEDFTICPSQDLLVLVEARAPRSTINPSPPFRIHLRTLSTNLPHPLARNAMLEQTITPYVDIDYTLRLQIMDHAIGVFFKANGAPGTSPPSLLAVWQWTTGFIKTMMSFTDFNVPDAFSFLSADVFVLPRFLPYSISPGKDDPASLHPVLEVYSMHSDDNHPIYPHPIRDVTLLLPSMINQTRFEEFKCLSDPAPTWLPLPSLGGASIIAHGYHAPVRLVLFTHAATLLSYAESLPFPSTVPWEDWGPLKSRWTKGPLSFSLYECCVFGNRFVHGMAKRNDAFVGWGRYRSLRVLDFNRYAVGRGVSAGEADEDEDHGVGVGAEDNDLFRTESGYSDGDESGDAGQGITRRVHNAKCRTITKESVIRKGAPFLVDAHSSLPYREITKRVSHPPFSSVTVDDERIICYASNMHAWIHTM